MTLKQRRIRHKSRLYNCSSPPRRARARKASTSSTTSSDPKHNHLGLQLKIMCTKTTIHCKETPDDVQGSYGGFGVKLFRGFGVKDSRWVVFGKVLRVGVMQGGWVGKKCCGGRSDILTDIRGDHNIGRCGLNIPPLTRGASLRGPTSSSLPQRCLGPKSKDTRERGRGKAKRKEYNGDGINNQENQTISFPKTHAHTIQIFSYILSKENGGRSHQSALTNCSLKRRLDSSTGLHTVNGRKSAHFGPKELHEKPHPGRKHDTDVIHLAHITPTRATSTTPR
ncbi:hypothetical protein ACFE04_026644 [Oxalis oulophora]